MAMAYILNWRDVQPKIAHMSAVHWGGFRDRERADDPDERNRLTRLGGFARHALQGRKTSDHHKHDQLEQVYYILSGRGEVLYGDERFPVRDGDAVYLPAGVHHQMFNDMNDEWLEHHVISQAVEGPGGELAICNWRQVEPQGDGGGAVCWRQLTSATRANEGVAGSLRALLAIERVAVQPTRQTSIHCEDCEQVYYVLEGAGVFVEESGEQPLVEGDMVHVPVGCSHSVKNPNEEWLVYMVMAA
jgi:mannose-6-phosphate isomerase-like protein (cupin superfamily)